MLRLIIVLFFLFYKLVLMGISPENGNVNHIEIPENYKKLLMHPFCIMQDFTGNIWIGTDGEGLFIFNPTKNEREAWTQLKGKSYFGDNSIMALEQDHRGRIWIGTQHSGVSVFNGEDWKQYDRIHGPIGERIFFIKTSPVNGDVWIATSSGLSSVLNC